MIPKTIHYCWFGRSPLPSLAIKCIESWKFFLPDYEIKEWNEDNFDVSIIPYTREAYEARKYAFVSDYARFYILYQYGGLYFDTDVEVIKSMDDIISRGPFMGCENEVRENGLTAIAVNPGLGLAVAANLGFYKEILNSYSHLHFNNSRGFNTTTVVEYITNMLTKYGLKNTLEIQEIEGILIYPKEYFCPINYDSGKIEITTNTYSIHHFAASWHSPWMKIKGKIMKVAGRRFTSIIVRLKRLFVNIR